MPAPSIRPAADPLDDIDRQSGGVDTIMERQDRADLPGERSDQPRPPATAAGQADDGDVFGDATREIAQESLDPRQEALDADREVERLADGDADLDLDAESLAPAPSARGADDDDPIDEIERAGDDSI